MIFRFWWDRVPSLLNPKEFENYWSNIEVQMVVTCETAIEQGTCNLSLSFWIPQK